MGINETNIITCKYNKNEQTINLLYDFNQKRIYDNEEEKKIYNESKNYMKNIYKKDIDIYK